MLRFHALLLLGLLACNGAGKAPLDLAADRRVLPDAAPAVAEGRPGAEASPADLAFPASPEQTGPLAVGITQGELVDPSYGKFPLYIYYPAVAAGADTAPERSRAPYPVVIFAHGHGGSGTVNTWVGKQLASWGYVSAFFSTPDPNSLDTGQWAAGIVGSIGYLAEKAKGTSGPLVGLLDAGRAAVVGHSQGASGALWAAAQGGDAIKVVVGLAPPGWFLEKDPAIKAAVQLQVGSLDGVCPPSAAQGHYDALAAPKQLLEIAGANHIGFLDAGIAYEAAKGLINLGLLADKLATISRDEQERVSRRYLTAWINRYLRGQTEFNTWLFGAEAQKDKTAGVLATLSFVE